MVEGGQEYRKDKDDKERERKGGAPLLEQVFTVQICFVYCWSLQAQSSNHWPSSFTQLFSLRAHKHLKQKKWELFIWDVNPHISKSVEWICHEVKVHSKLMTSSPLQWQYPLLCQCLCMWCVRDSLDLCSVLFHSRLLLKIWWNYLKSAVFFLLCWHIFLKQTGHINCLSFFKL